jgi:hypothetical protein
LAAEARAGVKKIMISAKLIELIEIHATGLTRGVTADLTTNEHTKGFRSVPALDLEQRIFEILHHLGDWIGAPKSEKVNIEFSDWGGRRFGQGIPLSELVYAMITLKRHLHRYIQDNGLVDAAFPRVEAEYVLPMHLQSLQDLNQQVTAFFDEALYALTKGYEMRSVQKVSAPPTR